jgi:hypothetical protein
MNSGHSTPNHTGLPHLSHAEPWAHNFICCDTEHQASTSASRGSTPLNRFPSRHPSHPSVSTTHPFNAGTACCDETQCSAGDVVECCDDPGCSEGAVCEDEGCHDPHTSQHLGGFDHSAQSMKELEEWACSKEGCHAIQQYVSLSLRLTFLMSTRMRSGGPLINPAPVHASMAIPLLAFYTIQFRLPIASAPVSYSSNTSFEPS